MEWGDIGVGLLYFVFLGLPVVATVVNFIRVMQLMFHAKPQNKKWKAFLWLNDIYTLLGGAFLSLLAYNMTCTGDWNVAIDIVDTPYHFALASEHLLTFVILAALSIMSLLYMKTNKRLSPIGTIVMYSFVYIGMFLSLVWMLQLTKNIEFTTLYLFLYPLNYILLSFVILKSSIESLNNNETSHIGKFVYKSCNSWAWGFVFLIPICGILILCLMVFGQKPDSIVKVFTETADWTFSQRIPPPPLDHTGHYLCTVAACGHKSVVKPLFVGKRHGNPIVVNRQLQIANAFEDLIAEKMPKTHKVIRKFYDKHGYPISKHITTPLRSSLVYIVMKPLEWVFLFVLYSVDVKPENRIERQYAG